MSRAVLGGGKTGHISKAFDKVHYSLEAIVKNYTKGLEDLLKSGSATVAHGSLSARQK